MKKYCTTISYLTSTKDSCLEVNPPDNGNWSLVNVAISPNGMALYYTWSKSVYDATISISSSDEEFEKACQLIKNENKQL